MSLNVAVNGALWPMVRQGVQFLAGLAFGAGALGENEVTMLAAAVASIGNLIWMLIARTRATPQ